MRVFRIGPSGVLAKGASVVPSRGRREIPCINPVSGKHRLCRYCGGRKVIRVRAEGMTLCSRDPAWATHLAKQRAKRQGRVCTIVPRDRALTLARIKRRLDGMGTRDRMRWLLQHAPHLAVTGGATAQWTGAGADGNWSTVLNWSTGAVPATGDDVVFGGTGGSNKNCSMDVNTNAIRSLNFAGAGTVTPSNYTGQFDFTFNTLTIGGAAAGNNIVFNATMTTTAAGASVVISQTANFTLTLTSAGKLSAVNVTINHTNTSATLQLADGLTTGSITLTQGKIDFNGKTCSITSLLSSNANTRTLTMGAAQITFTGTGTILDFTTATNLTVSTNTATLITTANSTSVTFAGGIDMKGASFKWAPSLAVTSGVVWTINGGFTVANLTYDGTSANGFFAEIQLVGTITVSTAVTFTGNSAINRVLVNSNAVGTQRTIALGAAGTASLTNVDFMDIAFTGTHTPVSGTSVGDGQGNSGITVTTPVTRYWVGGTGLYSQTAHWSTASGGASGASVPLPQDTVNFDANSVTTASQTITLDMPRMGKDFSWDLRNSPTVSHNNVTKSVYGNWTIVGTNTSGGATSTSMTIFFRGRGAQTLTPVAGQMANVSKNFTAPGGTYTLQADMILASGANFTLSAGTFDANGHAATVNALSSAGSATRELKMGGGAWTVIGTSTATLINFTSSLTLTVGGSTLALGVTASSNVTGTLTLTTAGLTMPNTTIGTTGLSGTGNGRTYKLGDNFVGNITLAGEILDFNAKTVTGTVTLNGGRVASTGGGATVTTLTIGGSVIITHGVTITATTVNGVNAPPTTWDADNFDRSDSTTALGSTPAQGRAWAQQTAATWGINTNKGYYSDTTNKGEQIAVFDPGQTDVLLECDVTLSATASRANAGLVFKSDGNGGANYLAVRIAVISGTANLILYKRDTSANTTLVTSSGFTPAVNTTYRIKVVAKNGTIDVWVDGTLRASYTMTSGERTKYDALTQVGLRILQDGTNDNGGSRWNNLTVLGGAAAQLETETNASAATISASGTSSLTNVAARDITGSGAGSPLQDWGGIDLSTVLGVGANTSVNFINPQPVDSSPGPAAGAPVVTRAAGIRASVF